MNKKTIVVVWACVLLIVPINTIRASDNSEPVAQLTVLVSEVRPLVIVGTDGKLSGFDIELWEAVAQKLGYRFKYQQVSFPNKIAALDGSIPVIQDRVIALGGITLTAEREKQFDFTHPYMTGGLAILSRSGSTSWLSVVQELFSQSWEAIAYFVCFVVACGILIALFETPNSGDPSVGDVFNGIYFCIVTITTVGYGDYAPKRGLYKVFTVAMILGGIIFFSYFISQLTSVSVNTRKELTSIQDLERKKIGVISGTATEDYMGGLDIHVESNMDNLLSSLREKEIDVVVHDAPTIRYLSTTNHDLEIAGPLLSKCDYGWATPSGSLLLEEVNNALLLLKETGEYSELSERWFGDEYH
jgi:polar amino acid transport system substrate-binding protein